VGSRILELIAQIRAHPGLVAAVVVQALAALVLWHFVTDDALISVRYARLLADGDGLRFNPGEAPVEGYSNFLWLLLAAAALRLGLPALFLLRATALVAALFVVALVYVAVHEAGHGKTLATIAGLVVALHAPFAYWTVSGLETAMHAALILVAVLGFVHLEGPRRRHLWIPILLVALCRFEGVSVGLCLIAVACARSWGAGPREFVRREGFWVGGFTLTYALYTAFRVVHFGHLLPDSASHKLGDAFAQVPLEFLRECPLLVLAALACPFRRLGTRGAVLGLVVVVHLVGFAFVHPSVSYFHRFLLPVFPFVTLLAIEGLVRIAAPGARARAASGLLLFAIVAWFIVAPWGGWPKVSKSADRLHERIVSRIAVAKSLRSCLEADAVVAIGDVGVVSFVLPNPVRDSFGLNDPELRSLPAKDRADSLVSQGPEAIVLVSRDTSAPHRYRYASDRAIAESDGLRNGYRPLVTIASAVERYHYLVFVRRDLPPCDPGVQTPLTRSVARELDALRPPS
jgi:hypothetical protein